MEFWVMQSIWLKKNKNKKMKELDWELLVKATYLVELQTEESEVLRLVASDSIEWLMSATPLMGRNSSSLSSTIIITWKLIHNESDCDHFSTYCELWTQLIYISMGPLLDLDSSWDTYTIIRLLCKHQRKCSLSEDNSNKLKRKTNKTFLYLSEF